MSLVETTSQQRLEAVEKERDFLLRTVERCAKNLGFEDQGDWGVATLCFNLEWRLHKLMGSGGSDAA